MTTGDQYLFSMENEENSADEAAGFMDDKSGDEETATDPEESGVLPVLPVRDIVVFNYMILPLFIGRDKSVKAVERAIEHGRHLLVCAQREEGIEDPEPSDLYETGTIVQIMRMLKTPDSRIKILVQGVGRAKVKEFTRLEPFMEARIETLPEIAPETDATVEALLRSVREQSEKVLNLRGIATQDIMGVLQSVDDPGRLADLIAGNLRIKISGAQELLETNDPLERLRRVNDLLARELEIATVQAKIQGAARDGMDKAQKEYFLREQLKAIRQELGDADFSEGDDLESLKQSLDEANLPKDVRIEADKQLRRLYGMHGDSSEANVVRSFLELIAELPWKKLSRDRLEIARAKEILDEDHCGLEKIKDRILEFLSVRKLNPNSKG
ncbi:MAG: endopeptidase La, partial [Desulfovibrio sp.]|nr:endopeptidase La [Desulfovibrio sp.]